MQTMLEGTKEKACGPSALPQKSCVQNNQRGHVTTKSESGTGGQVTSIDQIFHREVTGCFGLKRSAV